MANKIPTAEDIDRVIGNSRDSEDEFKHKLIEELHEINLSLRRLSGRDVVEEKPKTYKDFYFGKSQE